MTTNPTKSATPVDEPFALRPMTLALLAAHYFPDGGYDARMRALRRSIAADGHLCAHLSRLGVPLSHGRGRPVPLSLRAVCVIVRHLGWPPMRRSAAFAAVSPRGRAALAHSV